MASLGSFSSDKRVGRVWPESYRTLLEDGTASYKSFAHRSRNSPTFFTIAQACRRTKPQTAPPSCMAFVRGNQPRELPGGITGEWPNLEPSVGGFGGHAGGGRVVGKRQSVQSMVPLWGGLMGTADGEVTRERQGVSRAGALGGAAQDQSELVLHWPELKPLGQGRLRASVRISSARHQPRVARVARPAACWTRLRQTERSRQVCRLRKPPPSLSPRRAPRHQPGRHSVIST